MQKTRIDAVRVMLGKGYEEYTVIGAVGNLLRVRRVKPGGVGFAECVVHSGGIHPDDRARFGELLEIYRAN